jgi:hypothetical protein
MCCGCEWGGDVTKVIEYLEIQESRLEPFAVASATSISREPRSTTAARLPIGHHRYAHCWCSRATILDEYTAGRGSIDPPVTSRGQGRSWRKDQFPASTPYPVEFDELDGPSWRKSRSAAIMLSGFGAALLALMTIASFAMSLSLYAHVSVFEPRSIPVCAFIFFWSLAVIWPTLRH